MMIESKILMHRTIHESSSQCSNQTRRKWKAYWKMGDDISERIHYYLEASKDYESNIAQRLKLFHNIFNGKTQSFYRSKVVGVANTFGGFLWHSEMRIKQHHPTEERKTVSSESTSREKMETNQCTLYEALEEVLEVITRLTPQALQCYRDEGNKVEYTCGAVLGIKWAANALSKAVAADSSAFQQMSTDLDYAWPLHRTKSRGTRKRWKHYSSCQSWKTIRILLRRPRNVYTLKETRVKIFCSTSTSNLRGWKSSSWNLEKFDNTRRFRGCNSPNHFIANCPERNIQVKFTTNAADILRKIHNLLEGDYTNYFRK